MLSMCVTACAFSRGDGFSSGGAGDTEGGYDDPLVVLADGAGLSPPRAVVPRVVGRPGAAGAAAGVGGGLLEMAPPQGRRAMMRAKDRARRASLFWHRLGVRHGEALLHSRSLTLAWPRVLSRTGTRQYQLEYGRNYRSWAGPRRIEEDR